MSDVKMKNYMEDIVIDMLPSIFASMDVCQCDRCKLDVAAYALNKLPPKYVVTQKGHLYTKLSAMHQQMDVDVISVITQGAALVAGNPRHEA